MRDLILVAACAAISFSGVVVFTMPDRGSSMFSTALAGIRQHCQMKGNVSIESGERIYHVPGQKYYGATRIDARLASVGSALKPRHAVPAGDDQGFEGANLRRFPHHG